MAKPKFKSPIKAKPLRNPGQSLDDQLTDLLIDDVIRYIMVASIAIILAMLAWHRWYFNPKPSPWIYTIIAIITVIYVGVKISRSFKKAKLLKQGRDGEKAVGQYLESLRAMGAKVFHDIPGDNFNLDHVVICPSGIYVIETKTYSKPEKGEAKVLFDGENVQFNAKNGTNKPVIQVRAATRWLRELVEQSTGQKLMVKPVIVFPGWYVETTYEAKTSEIWVLNPKGLPAFISNSKDQLSKEQVNMVAYNLSRYIRNFEENKSA